ncbi:MAG: hypothetical protein E6G82_15115 [Alphaproteobacteria bacterium]|nr:MAG: hypothetical protein E6G82_15115 [Alphaproteobacteria bacterium]
MMLVNQGTIIASGINALDIDTGLNTIVNSGMLEATGSGGLVIDSNLDNACVLWANGANITLHGSVTGTGTASMDGTATLEFSGVVSGFNGDDHFDLAGVAFVAGTSAIYVANQDGTGGMLSVTDGTEGAQTVHIALLGQYSADGFTITADDSSGTLLSYRDHI